MRTLLVPLDGSPFSEQALPTALGIARRTSAGVTLVAVHEPPIPPFGAHGAPVFDARFDNERRIELRRYLEATRERAQASLQGLPVEAFALEGDPTETIASFAATHVPSLVVLASHGMGGPSRSWLGSVTDRLVRWLPMPVLVVQLPETPGEEGERGTFRRVVVPLDGSTESEAAIGHAVAVAGDGATEFMLLRVVPPLHPLLGAVATPGEVARDMSEQKAIAREYLEGATARANSPDLSLRTAIRVHLQPATAICEYATEIGADLIAMATHARGAMGRLLLGSVADKVVRTARVPVLLCHVATAAPGDREESGEAGDSQQLHQGGASHRA